jgi:exodeoxyribonuclease VII large subunit
MTLKDAESQLQTVVYRSMGLRLRFDLRDGLEVIARGYLTIYEPRGEYQLIVREIQPRGVGPLELAFRQLREKLFQRGWFDPKRKKPLPRFPRRIVLVTSPTGAAVRDMLEVIGRRWPAVEVWVCPVPVQGEGAGERIAAAIHGLNRLSENGVRSDPARRIDVLILGRGGGSLEDLWAFNEEALAQAIVQSRIPIVTGIGHETDLTIADLVADQRALTPSEAAERTVPHQDEVLGGLRDTARRMRTLLGRRLDLARTRLANLVRQRSFRLPLQRIRDEEQRLDEWNMRLVRALRLRLERSRQLLEAAAAQLESLSPLNVLARGYSLTRMASDQSVVRSSAQVCPGDRLVTLLHRGAIVSRVEDTTSEHPPAPGRTGT